MCKCCEIPLPLSTEISLWWNTVGPQFCFTVLQRHLLLIAVNMVQEVVYRLTSTDESSMCLKSCVTWCFEVAEKAEHVETWHVLVLTTENSISFAETPQCSLPEPCPGLFILSSRSKYGIIFHVSKVHPIYSCTMHPELYILLPRPLNITEMWLFCDFDWENKCTIAQTKTKTDNHIALNYSSAVNRLNIICYCTLTIYLLLYWKSPLIII